MRTTRTIALAAAFALAAVVAGSAFAGSTKAVSFTGKYSGTAVTKVTDNVADLSANGKGTGTLIGAGTVTGIGKGDTSKQPCVPFNGTGAIKGAKGGFTFKVLPSSSSCGDEAGESFQFTGTATLLKGTGALKKAKGSLRFTGSYDRKAGTFSVKFVGKLAL